MYRLLLSAVLLLLLTQIVYAQHDKQFKISPVETKISNSHYNQLHVIDSRVDTNSLGIVRVGAFNRKAKLIADTSLSIQLSRWFNAAIDQNAKSGSLVLHLRQFSVLEPLSMQPVGYCVFRAGLYKMSENKFSKIRDIDTMLTIRNAIDVTNDLLEESATLLTNFVTQNTTVDPQSNIDSFSYNELTQKLDSLEKKQLKLYNTTIYTDGLYLTYNSFKKQVPDRQVIVQYFNSDDINLAEIKTPNEKGKLKSVSRYKTYAVVFKGQLYIATRSGYYQMKKVNNDFIFNGEASPLSEDMSSIGGYGLIGGLVSAAVESHTTDIYEMKIDYVNGKFIKLKKIDVPSTIFIQSKNEDY